MDRYKEKIKCEICGYEYVKCNKSQRMTPNWGHLALLGLLTQTKK